jgi:hypothetical protein
MPASETSTQTKKEWLRLDYCGFAIALYVPLLF